MTASTTSPCVTSMVLTSLNLTTAQLESLLNINPTSGGAVVPGSSQEHANRLESLLAGGTSGVWPATLVMNLGSVAASATATITSTGPTNGETIVVAGVTLTAATSTNTGSHFAISATPSIVAANLAAAINRSVPVNVLTATVSAGVVTMTASVPGSIGNFVTVVNTNLANTTVTGSGLLANGTDGDTCKVTLP